MCQYLALGRALRDSSNGSEGPKPQPCPPGLNCHSGLPEGYYTLLLCYIISLEARCGSGMRGECMAWENAFYFGMGVHL